MVVNVQHSAGNIRELAPVPVCLDGSAGEQHAHVQIIQPAGIGVATG